MNERRSAHPGPGFWSLALLFLVVCAAATLNIMPINVGGDIVAKWEMVRHLTDPAAWPSWSVDHHTVRWALNFPATLAVWLFGPSLTVHYGITVVMFAVTTCLLWLVWHRLFGWAGALVLLTVFALNPMNSWLYSQFLPDNWSLVFVVPGLLLLLGPAEPKRVYGSAAFFFLAYAAKVTNLFFVPGILLWLWLHFGRANALRFLAVLAILFAIESAILSLVLGRFLPLGVVQAAMETHVTGMYTQFVGYSWSDTLTRWAPDVSMFVYTKAIMLLFLGAAAVTAMLKLMGRRLDMPGGISLTLAMGTSFAFLVSFAALSITPFRPVQPLLDRYLWPLWPFALTYAYWFGLWLVRPVWRRLREARSFPLITPPSGAVRAATILAVGGGILLGTTAHAYRKATAHRNGLPYPYTLLTVDSYFGQIAEAVRQCRPVVLWHPGTFRNLDGFLSPVGGPRWSSTVRVSEQPRDSYLRSFAPHLVGVTPEHDGTGPDVIIVEGKNCPPDPCRALIVGELAFAEQARCPSRRR